MFDALSNTGAGQARLLRFANCGCGCWCFKTVTQPRRYKLAANYCHDRFCVPCSNARGQTVALNIREHVGKKRVRFMTLTLQDGCKPLGDLLHDLVSSFRRLRSSKWWKARVRGGIAFTEIKYNREKRRWHVHVHAIVESEYLPQAELSERWRQASRGSFIVDIRQINDAKKVTSYVVKYATKAIDNQVIYIPPKLREAILALRGRRVMTTFGTWRGVMATAPVEDGDWIPVAPLRDLLARKARGDTLATWILSKLGRNRPWTRRLNDRAPPPDPYDGEHTSLFQTGRIVPNAE